jgi:cysteine desulfurase
MIASMTTERTYLDWNATAPLHSAARAAMTSALDVFGNPSSVHAEGRVARALMEDARDRVARLVHARAADIVLTSGATEANATVLAAGWDTILLSSAEHDSVLAAARASGARLIYLPIDEDGRVAIEAVADHVLRGPALGRALVSLQCANNETGVIQPVVDLVPFARAHGIAVHTDAVQVPGRIDLDVAALDAEYVSISSHKFGGPKGIGAVIIRDGAALPALVHGGGQERRRRAGTEAVTAIAGFGAAADAAAKALADIPRQRRLRDHLEASLSSRQDCIVVGAKAERLANTTCIAFPGQSAETLVIKLDLAGIAVSAGSACSSGKVASSHVLTAMGLAPEIARGAIRVSIGSTTTDADIARFLAASETILRAPALAA